MRAIKPRYPTAKNGKFIIEIKADSLRQLFDERDPNPFREKDLDDDAVEYIVSSVEEVSRKKVSHLKILTHDRVDDHTRSIIGTAVRDFFFYREEITGRKLRWILDIGLRSLVIGLIFLSISISASKSLGQHLESPFWGSFIKEGLLLMGWVSMWKPINIFLYEWWPLLEIKNIYRTLSLIDIELVQSEKQVTDIFGTPPRLEKNESADKKVSG